MERRPPLLHVADDAPLRQDVDSDDVRRVYPSLPATPQERTALLRARDAEAYRAVKNAFPPPGAAASPVRNATCSTDKKWNLARRALVVRAAQVVPNRKKGLL